MVCWQQAKKLYKYRGSLHTRMRTHTPPDEQNQSSGTAELRFIVPTIPITILRQKGSTSARSRRGECCAMASSGGKEGKYDCKVNICQVETANNNLHGEAQDQQLIIFLNLRGICLFFEAPQDNQLFFCVFFCEWHLYKANKFQNNLPSRNFNASTVVGHCRHLQDRIAPGVNRLDLLLARQRHERDDHTATLKDGQALFISLRCRNVPKKGPPNT